METNISNEEFFLLKKYIYDSTGINLSNQKVNLLKTRLNKRLTFLNLKTFKEYYDYLLKNKDEYIDFVNAVSTNVTSFFREPKQWDFLKNEIHNIINKNDGKLRIWSAASSTGEEPYTIGMVLKEELKSFDNFDIRILATDISHEALEKAIKGFYPQKAIDGLKKSYVYSYFKKINKTEFYSINYDLKSIVTFREFNLVYGDYTLFGKTKFDIIFCRNVMIYFDNETKNKIINNLVKKLNSGGYIILGHSENLIKVKDLEYVIPTIYRKV